MSRIVCFGELMVSLSPKGYSRFIQADEMDLCYTGAEANVAVSLSRYGQDACEVTKLPENEIADAAIACLRKYGVDTSRIVHGGERIGVIYTEKGASQRPSKVIYDRRHSSIAEASEADFDWDAIFENADWFHFTGITPALGGALPQICLRACSAAKANGVTVSCDLNYRKKLWNSDQAKRVMETLLPSVDLLIANEEDAEKVLGVRAKDTDVKQGVLSREGYVRVAEELTGRYGVACVATTLRTSITASDNLWSAMLYRDGNAYFAPEYRVHIVNRVGGGDSFAAGLIYGGCMGWSDEKALRFATAASCLKHSIEQDFNLVSVSEVETLANGDGSGRVQR